MIIQKHNGARMIKGSAVLSIDKRYILKSSYDFANIKLKKESILLVLLIISSKFCLQ